MVRVDKPYTFGGPDGPVSLLDLFDGRPQLVMHHFMFGPDWDQGCPSCASAADGIGRLRQLHVRNTTLVAVSRAPQKKLNEFRERMGWTFPWYSSFGTDFNYDFHATLDDRVEPVLLHFRTAAELAETGTPWTGGPWEASMNGENSPASAHSCGSATRCSTPTQPSAGASKNSTTVTTTSISPPSAVRRNGKNRKDARSPSGCTSAPCDARARRVRHLSPMCGCAPRRYPVFFARRMTRTDVERWSAACGEPHSRLACEHTFDLVRPVVG